MKKEAKILQRGQQRQVLILVFGICLFLGLVLLPIALMQYGKPAFFRLLGFGAILFGIGACGIYVQKRKNYEKSIFAGRSGRFIAITLILLGIAILSRDFLRGYSTEPNSFLAGVFSIVYGVRELRKNLKGEYEEEKDVNENI
jgi:FtsH-binding integral membrane protein